MYCRKDGKHLPVIITALGLTAMVLRWCLYAFATDAKGLLTFAHPLEVISWVLTAAVMVYIVASVWRLDGAKAYEDNFSPSLAAALGQWLAAVGFLMTALSHDPIPTGFLELTGRMPALGERILAVGWKVLGIAAGPCLIWAGLCRLRGKMPNFTLYLAPCLFLVLHIVNHYRGWSGKPQLMDYAYALFGAVSLMLFAYYSSAYSAGILRRRMQIGTGLAAAYFCVACLLPGQYQALYLGGAAWAVTGLATLSPKPLPPAKETAK